MLPVPLNAPCKKGENHIFSPISRENGEIVNYCSKCGGHVIYNRFFTKVQWELRQRLIKGDFPQWVEKALETGKAMSREEIIAEIRTCIARPDYSRKQLSYTEASQIYDKLKRRGDPIIRVTNQSYYWYNLIGSYTANPTKGDLYKILLRLKEKT